MQNWLLGYEFPETIILVTQEKIVFALSSKKGEHPSWVIGQALRELCV
jgi:nucleosome binding factor SPN SPT16 subunit